MTRRAPWPEWSEITCWDVGCDVVEVETSVNCQAPHTARDVRIMYALIPPDGWATACGAGWESTPSRLCGEEADLVGGGGAAMRQESANEPQAAATASHRRPPAYTAFPGLHSPRLPSISKVAEIGRITRRPSAPGLQLEEGAAGQLPPDKVTRDPAPRSGRSVSPKLDGKFDRKQVSRRAGSNDVNGNRRPERPRKGWHGSSSTRLGRIQR
jgi:hypothetical protein